MTDYQVGPTGLGSARAEQRFRVDPNLLGSLHEGEAFVISQRRAQLVKVTRRPVPDAAQLRAAELLRPRVHAERLVLRSVTPEQAEHKTGNRLVMRLRSSSSDDICLVRTRESEEK